MYLPTPTELTTLHNMDDYHIFSFGPSSGVHVVTVMNQGNCHDSYVVVPNPYGRTNYITLEYVR